MANFFYARTLPTPRVVSTSGGTWLSLGFPTASVALIPAEYVDGGGLGYLVQFQIQRTSTNATIRLNLDTNPSGSGGAALPEFINLFETRGLFRLTAGSVSRVFNLADATTGDTEEPYVWSWASAAVASEMRAVVDALRVGRSPIAGIGACRPGRHHNGSDNAWPPGRGAPQIRGDAGAVGRGIGRHPECHDSRGSRRRHGPRDHRQAARLQAERRG